MVFLIVGVASTAHILIAARALQGLGAAVVAPTSLTLITAVFYNTVKQTRATAAYGTMAGLGFSGGMLIGGLITTFLSWRFGFWINVPIAVVVLVLAVRFLPTNDHNDSENDGNNNFAFIHADIPDNEVSFGN